jgi:hypothetical protein
MGRMSTRKAPGTTSSEKSSIPRSARRTMGSLSSLTVYPYDIFSMIAPVDLPVRG